MILTIYRDSACKVPSVSPLISEYSALRQSNSSANQFSQGTYPAYNGTDTPENLTLQAWYQSQINQSASQLSKEGTTFIPDFVNWDKPQPSGTTRNWLFLSPRAAIAIQVYKTGNQYYCRYPEFLIREADGWYLVSRRVTDPIPIGSPGATIIGFRLGICKKANVTAYGGVYTPNGDYLAMDILYREPAQTGISTYWAIIAISKWRDYIGDIFPEPGYDPKNNSKKGGRGTGTVPRGTIPNLPTANVNSLLMATCQGHGNGLSYYKLTTTALSKVTTRMYPKIDFLGKSAANRQKAFVSLVGIPYSVPTEPNTADSVFLADDQVPVDTGTAPWLSSLMVPINFGTFELARTLSDTYADIVYTSYTLYLPGAGSINIDPATCAQGAISVEGSLDLRNGNILYRIKTRTGSSDNEVIYAHVSGNIGVQIPLSGSESNTNFAKNAGTALVGAVTAMAGAAMGKPSVLAAGLAGAASGSMAAIEDSISTPHYDLSGSLDTMTGGYATPGCRLLVTQNYLIQPKNYITLVGRPSTGLTVENSETGEITNESTIGTYRGSGFLRIVSADLTQITCTDGEKAEIMLLLQKGVFL